MSELKLPKDDRSIEVYRLSGTPVAIEKRSAADFNRVAFAAAHVVADPLADNDPWLTPAIDWDATLRFRHRLWDLGLGVAEAMDTAQRGMGLAWPQAQELISRSLKEAASRKDALIACGVGTDHLNGSGYDLNQIIHSYLEQLDFVQGEGGRVILMASRALAAAARSPDDYLKTYARVLSRAEQKVVLHWLGEMFDPALEGYWGSGDHMTAMYTGDDFNYAELIAGDEQGHSDALLGIFDAIAPAASKALASLKRGADNEFFDILEPTVALSRHIFKAPTRFYKTGVVFLAYLNGLQDHFTMVGGQESSRSTQHFAELFRLADKANVLAEPDLATHRMKAFLAVRGIS